MSRTAKVLLFVDRMRVGGIQTLLEELLEEFRAMQQPCDLLLLDDGEHYDLEDTVRQRGITVHKLKGIWLRRPWDFLKYQEAVRHFFMEHHDYAAVHLNSGPKNYPILKYAKQYGIPVRIAHAHNTGFQTSSRAAQLLGHFCKGLLRHYATHCLACSDLAGRWMFGSRRVEEGRVMVLPNGIPLQDYAFRPEVRHKMRAEWGAGPDTLVVGHVGRFTKQKNHRFLLEIFAQLHCRHPDSILVLAGVGELQEDARRKADELHLMDSVRFLGFRSDVADLLQAMDVFLMPSLFEGFPVTGVEAQAAGLPCVFSDTMTREAKILDAVEYLPLDMPASQWADAAARLAKGLDRQQACRILMAKGYDVHIMAEKLLEVYHSQDAGQDTEKGEEYAKIHGKILPVFENKN